MVLAINQSLYLLEDESAAECSDLNFEATIECLTVSSCGNLSLCALADGNIYGIHIKGYPLFNLIIENIDIGASKTFVGINYFEGAYYLMCRSGTIYRYFFFLIKVSSITYILYFIVEY